MKNQRIQQWVMAFAIMMLPIISSAQPGQGNGQRKQDGSGCQKGQRFEQRGEGRFMNIPDLTEEQKDKLKSIHVGVQEDLLPIRNQINEKEAVLLTLQSADKPDMKAINSKIDEIGGLKSDIAKRRALAHQDIRKELNDEQRLFFDTEFQNRGNGNGSRPNRGGGRGK